MTIKHTKDNSENKIVKMNILKMPMEIQYGKCAEPLFEFTTNQINFFDKVRKVMEKIQDETNAVIPSLGYNDNSSLRDEQVIINIYGTKVGELEIHSLSDSEVDKLLDFIREKILYYVSLFKDQTADKEIEKLKKENTREACVVIYNYYHNIVCDKKAAFHWLKKMAYFGSPRDLRNLAHAYNCGVGCAVDHAMAKKINKRTSGQDKDIIKKTF